MLHRPPLCFRVATACLFLNQALIDFAHDSPTWWIVGDMIMVLVIWGVGELFVRPGLRWVGWCGGGQVLQSQLLLFPPAASPASPLHRPTNCCLAILLRTPSAGARADSLKVLVLALCAAGLTALMATAWLGNKLRALPPLLACASEQRSASATNVHSLYLPERSTEAPALLSRC